jgi:hypothetical protein
VQLRADSRTAPSLNCLKKTTPNPKLNNKIRP